MAMPATRSAVPRAATVRPRLDALRGGTSNGRAGHPRADRDLQCGGFSLFEVVLVTALVGVLTMLIVKSLADLTRSQAFTTGQLRTAELADRLLRPAVDDVSFSVRVFDEGSDSDAYLALLAVPRDLAMRGSRLPVLTNRGYFDLDGLGRPETGNLLFLGRYEQPALVRGADADSELRVDTVAFVLYFLERRRDGALDLSRYASVPLARYSDVMAVADLQERRQILVQLHSAGIRFTWDVDAPARQGLLVITAEGLLRPLALEERIPAAPEGVRRRLLANSGLQVAPNGKVGRLTVPRYARADGDFPAGFEVKVDGGTTGKLMLLRLVLCREAEGSDDNFAEIVRLIPCRSG